MRYIYACASHSKWKTAEYAVCMCVYMSTFRKAVEVSDSHMQPFVLSFYCSLFPHFLFIFASLIPSKSAMETPYNGNNYRYSIFIYGSEFDLNWLCVCSRNSRRENEAGREGKAPVASRRMCSHSQLISASDGANHLAQFTTYKSTTKTKILTDFFFFLEHFLP